MRQGHLGLKNPPYTVRSRDFSWSSTCRQPPCRALRRRRLAGQNVQAVLHKPADNGGQGRCSKFAYAATHAHRKGSMRDRSAQQQMLILQSMLLLCLRTSGRALLNHQTETQPTAAPVELQAIEAWNTGPQAVAVAVADNAPGSGTTAAALLVDIGTTGQQAAVPPVAEPVAPHKPLRGAPTAGLLDLIATDQPRPGPGAASSTSLGPPTGGSSNLITAANASADSNQTGARVKCTPTGPAAVPNITAFNGHSSGSLPQPGATSTSSSSSNNSSSSSSDSANGGSPLPLHLPQHDLPMAGSTAVQVAAAGVPDRCIIAGSVLFSSCAVEIAAAQAHFNLTVPYLAPQNYTQLLQDRGVTRPQVLAYLQEALSQPSSQCCAAQCCFNQLLLCDCEASVLQVAVRFAGADEPFYALLVSTLARSCGTQFFYGTSCPTQPSAPAGAAACTATPPWPPVAASAAATESPSPAVAAGSDGQLAEPKAELGPSGAPRLVCLASHPAAAEVAGVNLVEGAEAGLGGG